MANSIPLGIRLLPSCSILDRTTAYKIFILVFTFVIYTSFHLSRKPISVVKNALFHNSCHTWEPDKFPKNSTACDWAPFDGSDHDSLLGSLDLAYLFAYAVGMFLSGHIAERMNLRHFLVLGMISSGIMTAAFGFGYFFKIHVLWFYILVQVVGGMVQASGWPSVVTCVGNWWGKGKRGFIMGVWNSHTSVGNITGSLIAGIWVNHAWGWSFAVPGMIITGLGIIVFLFLVTEPSIVGCEDPDQPDPDEYVTSDEVHVQNGTGHMANNDYQSATSVTPLLKKPVNKSEEKAIPIHKAVLIPGVIEFSLCLFFAKLVSYTFLFWLPKYIKTKNTSYNAEESADLSTLFDVGGILGGITAGIISDYTGARASTCAVMLILAAPMMYILNLYGAIDYAHTIGLLMACGYLVNGPYALITTAVSADLGTHKSLQGNSKALATVTAIIDGTGSIGAALGPLLTGVLWQYGTMAVFWMLIGADLAALVFLARLVVKEIAASRFCSPPLLVDDIVVDNSERVEKSDHFQHGIFVDDSEQVEKQDHFQHDIFVDNSEQVEKQDHFQHDIFVDSSERVEKPDHFQHDSFVDNSERVEKLDHLQHDNRALHKAIGDMCDSLPETEELHVLKKNMLR